MVYWPDILVMAIGANPGGMDRRGNGAADRTAVHRIVIGIGFAMALSLFIKK